MRLTARRFLAAWYSLMIALAVAAFLVNTFASTRWAMAVASFPLGALIGSFLTNLADLWHEHKIDQLRAELPKSVQFLARDEEHTSAVVTKFNGETVMVNLPADYDPRTDGGELLLRQVVPDFFPEEEHEWPE